MLRIGIAGCGRAARIHLDRPVALAEVTLKHGTPVTLAVSGMSPESLFELNFRGERGRIRVAGQILELDDETGSSRRRIALPEQAESIDGNFVAALIRGTPPCCPAGEALDTVRLLEAVARSAATGQRFASLNDQPPRQGRHSRPPYHGRSIRGPIVIDSTRPKESLFKVPTPGCRPIQKANRSRNFGSVLEETSSAANDPGGDRPQPGNLDT